MMKKTLTMLITAIAITSLVACGNSNKENEAQTKNETDVVEKANIIEKKFIGQGEWANDYTKEEVLTLNDEIMVKVEELANFYGLEYLKEEGVEEIDGEIINENSIYTDNLNPEPNRLESMKYGLWMYGADASSGSLNLKIGFKLDLKQIKTEEKFDFGEISIAEFSKAMTNDDERDYSELNEEIKDIVINKNADGTIETNLNGLVETITVKDDFLLYKLDSKKYDFKK